MANKTARLGDLATYINGYAFKPADWGDTGLPIIRIQDLTGNSYQLNRYDGEYPERIEVNEGDVLISWSASLGVYVWQRGKALLNQHIFKVVFDKLPINKDYFVFAVEHKLAEMESKTHGATMKHIVKKDFDGTTIPYPTSEKQAEIADHLRRITSIIDKQTEQLLLLDQLVKSRFIELFGDLKSNPMEWPVVPFTEFAKIDGNMTMDYEKYADYPHIGIDSIEKGTGALKGYRTVREDGVISGKYIFTPQHIIYSKIRPNLNKVALPDFEGLCSADAYPILPNHDNCNRVFLAIALRSEFFLEYILQFSSRTNLPKVNRKEIAGFRMPLPPLKLQEQFAAFVEQTDKSKYYSSLSFRYCQAAANTYRQEWMTCRTSDF